jgi:hypothetical protein
MAEQGKRIVTDTHEWLALLLSGWSQENCEVPGLEPRTYAWRMSPPDLSLNLAEQLRETANELIGWQDPPERIKRHMAWLAGRAAEELELQGKSA